MAEETAHPMVMPGIFAEIELARQISIVEGGMTSMEKNVLELDIVATSYVESASSVHLQQRIDRRNAWLDLTYLRDYLLH